MCKHVDCLSCNWLFIIKSHFFVSVFVLVMADQEILAFLTQLYLIYIIFIYDSSTNIDHYFAILAVHIFYYFLSVGTNLNEQCCMMLGLSKLPYFPDNNLHRR